ncbi:MAG: nucleotidyltransferase family protein [Saccharofermentans sp.]|nr:nucleotidyltransferase family protein [Saccharofermentans sp.]
MDQTCQVLIDLLKKSLWGTELPDYTTLVEPVDWTAVFTEAKNQSVASLAYPAIPDDVPQDLRDKWESYSDKLRVRYHHVLAAQDELLDLLSRNNIPAVILKGAAAAVYYPSPSRRSMGDIDLLVPQDLYDKAEELLKTSGYIMVHDRSENPRHSMFAKGGINFELHHHFSHDGIDIEEYLIDGLDHPVTEKIDGHQFPMLPSLPNGLVLLDHMRSHLVASGMGLRQVIDWMMYVNTVLNDDYWNNSFMAVIKEKELYTLAIVATKMCIHYLGLPSTITWCYEADDSLCTDLINYIFSSGNFGRKKRRRGQNRDRHNSHAPQRHIPQASTCRRIQLESI